MAEQPVVKTSGGAVKRYGSMLGLVVIVLGVICGAAFYQEDIQRYIRLRLWDKEAPGRAVTAFLKAAKEGNAEEAGRYLGSSEYHPLKEGSKAIGYFVTSPAGIMDFRFSDMVPEGDIKTEPVNFVLIGEGSAEVKVPHGNGEFARYRLKMFNGEWKINDILDGGKQRKPNSQPSGGTPPR
jgi:hypothetical protein